MTQKKLTVPFITLRPGEYSSVSDAGTAALRYNFSLARIEVSLDSGPYFPLGGGGGGGDGYFYEQFLLAPQVSPILDGYLAYIDYTSTELNKISIDDLLALGGGGGVASVGADAPLSSTGGANPVISFTGWPSSASGALVNDGYGNLTWSALSSTSPGGPAGSVQINDGLGGFIGYSDLAWNSVDSRLGIGTATPNERLTVSGALSLAESAAPSATANFGKFFVLSSDGRPYFLDDAGQSYNLTLDRFNTLTPAPSVAIDTNPSLPGLSSLAISQNTAFTTSNLGNGRSASILISNTTGSAYNLTWPGTWTWLGAGAPASIAANTTGYLSIVAYGATDAAVIAAWAYSDSPAVVTGSGAATRVAFWDGTTSLSSNTDLYWDNTSARLGIGTASPNERLTVSGVLSLAEGTTPSATANFGKFYTLSSDSRPYFLDDAGQAYNLTLDRFNTLPPAASVVIDTNPSLPVFNSLAISQNTAFTTSNLGNGRSASVRVSNATGSAYNLTWPGTWTWLGSGPPTSIAANTTGYLSITAYGATDASVVAAWSFSGESAAVTGSGTATRVAFWSGTTSLSSNANLYWDNANSRLGINTASPSTAIDLATGQLAIPDGTAAAPAIALRDDLNTGIFSPANDVIGISVNATEVARFLQSSSEPALLMGTSTAIGNITVDATSSTAGAAFLAHGSAGTTQQESFRGGQFAGARTRGTKAAPTQIGADDGMLCLVGTGWTSAAALNYGALITMKAEEAFTATASGARIEFHTTLNGTDGIATLGGATTERMRITNAGLVGIGTTAPAATLSVGATSQFQVNSSGNIARINNIPYTFPASQGTANTVLTNDGYGALSWSSSGGGGSFVTLDTVQTITATKTISVTSTATALRVIQAGTGASFIVEDSGSDTTPFIVDTNGNVGIQNASPSAALSVGASSQFRVNSTGDLVRINNVSYFWPASQGSSNTILQNDGSGNLSWAVKTSGTVTNVAVASANGFGGTVTNPSTVPEITISTSVTGLLKGESGGVTAAIAGSDYALPGNYVTLDTVQTITETKSLDVTSASAALRITQNGTGEALRVEDSTYPDGTPFVIDATGQVGIGTGLPSARLEVSGDVRFGSGSITVNTVTYNWPFSQGSAGTVLQNDGSGTLSWGTPSGGGSSTLVPISTKTSNYTMTTSDGTILADATSGAIIIALPQAATATERVFTIKKKDVSANVITIDPNGSEQIDGALTYTLSTQYEAIKIHSDGVAWWII